MKQSLVYVFRWKHQPYRVPFLFLLFSVYILSLLYFDQEIVIYSIAALLAIYMLDKGYCYLKKDDIAIKIVINDERVKITNNSSTLWIKEIRLIADIKADVQFDPIAGEQHGILFLCHDGDSFRIVTSGLSVTKSTPPRLIIEQLNRYLVDDK